MRKWEIYESCVAALMAEKEDADSISVTANAKIRGVISARSRQIDVLIEDLRLSPQAYRIIVDAKLRKRALDVEDIEAFEGKMKDVSAHRGILVVSSQATRSAKRRAEDTITIEILPFEEVVEEYDWRLDPCLAPSKLKHIHSTVLWSPHKVIGLGPGWLMYRTGKCSACGSFHVCCGDCGSEFAILDGRLASCGCEDRAWGAIPESKTSGHVGEPTSTWLMLRHEAEFIPLERKPIGKVGQQLDSNR